MLSLNKTMYDGTRKTSDIRFWQQSMLNNTFSFRYVLAEVSVFKLANAMFEFYKTIYLKKKKRSI